jgi:hypothetical protein
LSCKNSCSTRLSSYQSVPGKKSGRKGLKIGFAEFLLVRDIFFD